MEVSTMPLQPIRRPSQPRPHKWEPDWDEFRALGVKCVWAVAAIGTDEAWAALDAAATEGPDVIREEVAYERGRRSSRGPAPM
jgi:hypothetical protein